MRLTKKITTREVMGNMKAFMRENSEGKKDGELVELYTIVGQVIGHTTGESDYGPWVKLKGRFRAVNKSTGEVINSPVAMLPDEATTPLLTVLAVDGASSVDMAFDVNARIDDSVAVGYQYEVKPLMEPSEDDPLERLAASVDSKALPAPKKDKTPPAEPSEAAK